MGNSISAIAPTSQSAERLVNAVLDSGVPGAAPALRSAAQAIQQQHHGNIGYQEALKAAVVELPPQSTAGKIVQEEGRKIAAEALGKQTSAGAGNG